MAKLTSRGGFEMTQAMAGYVARWLQMESRPGALPPIKGGDIISRVIMPPPVGLSISGQGVEQVGQDTTSYVNITWSKPAGSYAPASYKLQVQPKGKNWTVPVEVLLSGNSYHFVGPGSVEYEARVAAVSAERQVGEWSSMLLFSMPKDETEPTISAGLSLTPSVGGITINLNKGVEDTDWSKTQDWAGAIVYMGTFAGFVCNESSQVAKGKQSTFQISGLNQGQIYYFKAVVYDTSGNMSAPTIEANSKAGQASTDDILAGAISDGSVIVDGIEVTVATLTPSIWVDVPGAIINFTLEQAVVALVYMSFGAIIMDSEIGGTSGSFRLVLDGQPVQGTLRALTGSVNESNTNVSGEVTAILTKAILAGDHVLKLQVFGSNFASAKASYIVSNGALGALILKR
jgi:hypothetical protein